jgi:hypothetical protein
MATFPRITQTGNGNPPFWINSGGNITNHEVFTFTLQQAPKDVGTNVSDVTVFLNTDFVPNRISYEVRLHVVDEFLNPSSETVVGNFESTGI